MEYQNIVKARFLSRPNRFIAVVELEGQEVKVHVKNTGRCAELLIPGTTVYLEKASTPLRKTPYDLVGVEKQRPAGPLLINMDSAAPNAVAGEWLRAGGLGPMDEVKAEYKMGDSRFDFFCRRGDERWLIEVKGCTLEEEGLALFPDAPTLRGLKHVEELTALAAQGWNCCVLIVIQMKEVHLFRPNWATHPQFARALQTARQAGVQVLAMDCVVTPSSLWLDAPVPVDLS
ncbi:MAG: DNA/RNA nuclease SfsA [Oscillospiraceae bacterium]|nr:DNA/RNA nuclease SfsA [Oscillospiraceae bacterium]